jgi:hypothetical protein
MLITLFIDIANRVIDVKVNQGDKADLIIDQGDRTRQSRYVNLIVTGDALCLTFMGKL